MTHRSGSLETIPSYFPTEEEFARGPLAYVESISGQASAFGIAHIVPPPSWNPPPLALRTGCDGIDVSTFRFGVRIQPTSALCRRPPGEFGFARGPRAYTLPEFEELCRAFERSHFGKTDPTDPTVEEVEDRFWRIVDGGEGTVQVPYGSDLDNTFHGSGFPMPMGLRRGLLEKNCVYQRSERSADQDSDKERTYRGHPWNVNNFSLHPRSVLSYLVDQGNTEEELVSGVMVPWVYVGSTYAAFNWHVEDHALYSVNYLHEGKPKVWYCCPGEAASHFEEAMRDALPHLFEESPDLLFQLVTQLHPRELQARGVEVYRVVHTPGSFIVTMPNVYHTGFNTGFNVAESCNFGALPWLRYSHMVMEKYAGVPRPVSISHDMMLVRIIERCTEKDIVDAAKHELQYRIAELRPLWDNSIPAICQREADVQHGKERAPSTAEADCAVCQTDLWLVGCYCVADEKETPTMVCLKHASALEVLPQDVRVSYNYTLDQLVELCQREY